MSAKTYTVAALHVVSVLPNELPPRTYTVLLRGTNITIEVRMDVPPPKLGEEFMCTLEPYDAEAP